MQNVDTAEIQKFEELAERWWDPTSEFKPLHDINPLRANFIDLHSPVKGKTVLDVGCGGGLLSEAMAEKGAIVTGIDMGEAPLSVARLHLLESGLSVDYQQITAEELRDSRQVQEAPKFDVVTCLEMLEHVPDPASVVAACADMVKPDGAVYFSTINRNAKAWLMAVIGAEYVLQLLPKGTHEYDKFITPFELEQYANAAGLVFEEMIGLHYNPLTKRYWLGAGVDVNYMVRARKLDAS